MSPNTFGSANMKRDMHRNPRLNLVMRDYLDSFGKNSTPDTFLRPICRLSGLLRSTTRWFYDFI